MSGKKQYIWLAIAGTLVAACIAAFVFWWNGVGTLIDRPISAVTCDLIQLGMTEEQVASILGRPPNREFHPWDVSTYLPFKPGEMPEWEKMWIGGDGAMIIVDFDAEGKVCNKAFSLKWE